MYMTPSRLAAEGPGQAAPHGVVVALAVGRLHGLPGRYEHPAALEHERQGVVDLLRPQLGRAGPLVGLGVRPVRGEGVVQARPAGLEPFGFGVVDTADQAHELGHDVAVVPGRPEGVLAPSQRGGKITKSALARPGSSLGEVSTVKMDGSGWSKLIEPITMKFAVSYLYGA